MKTREGSDDLLHDAVSEILLFQIVAVWRLGDSEARLLQGVLSIVLNAWWRVWKELLSPGGIWEKLLPRLLSEMGRGRGWDRGRKAPRSR